MKTKAKWQKCGDPMGAAGQWITPPECQGQIVLRSYASGEDGIIYLRVWDQSDGSREYHKRLLAEEELFEPWNVEPD